MRDITSSYQTDDQTFMFCLQSEQLLPKFGFNVRECLSRRPDKGLLTVEKYLTLYYHLSLHVFIHSATVSLFRREPMVPNEMYFKAAIRTLR